MPAVIFVTAHPDYAVPAFEAHAVDYLLKPFERARFDKALARARERLRGAAPPQPPRERLLIKAPGRLYFLTTAEIDWIEAAGNYLRLHAGGKDHLLRETMSNLERDLDPKRFVRIHRSTIVNLERVAELQPLFHGDYAVLLLDGTQLTLSRGYRHNLSERFGDVL
jgi:two-component system LytT family response regulator